MFSTGKKMRFALFGCGSIANKHVTALNKLDGAQICGAYDISHDSAREFNAKYSIPVFDSVDELMKKAEPDIVNILTPSGLHCQNIMELLKFKKHLVVEKPLALKLDDADKAVEECRKSKIKLFVVLQNRFNPPVKKLKFALEQGRFGKLVLGTVRVRWCREERYFSERPWRGTLALDGGVLSNQANHHIDMLLWLLGSVKSVAAKTATRLSAIEAADTAAVVLKFANGALGIIEATTAARPKDLEGSISVLGERGAVEIGGFFMNELKAWNFSVPEAMDKEIWDKYARVPDEPAWNHSEFFKSVLENVRSGSEDFEVSPEARSSIKLINAIEESARTGREVVL